MRQAVNKVHHKWIVPVSQHTLDLKKIEFHHSQEALHMDQHWSSHVC